MYSTKHHPERTILSGAAASVSTAWRSARQQSVLIAAAMAVTACNSDQVDVTAPSGGPRVVASVVAGANGIVFATDRDGFNRNELYVMNEDGSGLTNITHTPPISENSPAVSADGQKIAFTGQRFGEFEFIYTMNADGSNVTNLTADFPRAGNPAWSPDGTKIAFQQGTNIFVMNADGSNRTPLTMEEFGGNTTPDWSPDGSRIAFASARGSPFAIYSMGADGSDVLRVTTPPAGGEDRFPAWSPDGQRIVFWRRVCDAVRCVDDLYLVNADGTGEIALTADLLADQDPDWSLDGTRIVFQKDNQENVTNIYSINVDGSDLRQLTVTSGGRRDGGPTWGVFGPPLNTPAGSGIVVTPADNTTNTTPATLTFATVTEAGTTTLTTNSQGAAPPEGFQLGDPPLYYELLTTATFTGSITVCIDYSGTTFAGTGDLHLLHGSGGGTWTDVTTTSDPGSNTICGTVSSLSPFIVAQETSPAAQPHPLFLRGTGANANPSTLFLNAVAPTATTAKYKDSPSIKFSGGNPYKEVGTWTAEPAVVSGSVTALGDAQVWLGLKNSDDIGTRFDVRVEVYKNNELVASGEARCIQGVTRNEAQAKRVVIAFGPFSPVSFNGTSDVLRLKKWTRIGTTGTGAFCGGHSNAVGLRSYFDATSRAAGFDATF